MNQPLHTPAVFFSDLHVDHQNQDRWQLLMKFLQSEQTRGSKQIFLLGDIFDLMIGRHISYFKLYKDFFDQIASYLSEGKIVYYFQGNHDFHLKKLFDDFLDKYEVKNKHALILLDGPQVFSFNSGLVYLSHGDELDIHNHAYQRYKKIIRSRVAKILAEKFVSEKVLRKIANYLARKSKEHQKNFDWDRSFTQYRNYVQSLWEKGIHGVIVGHSHVCDAWEEGIHFYYNVGFAPQERLFLYLGPDGLQFVPLE